MADTLGTRILKLRGQNETQQKLADALGVSRSLVKAWENNDRTPKLNDLLNLASHYGASVDFLLGLIDEDNATNDEKLRRTSEFTGLSNDAILSTTRHRDTQYLSDVLSHDAFYDLISAFDDLSNELQHCREYCDALKMIIEGIAFSDEKMQDALRKALHKEVIKEVEIEDVYFDLQFHYDLVRTALFEMKEKWSDLLESVMPAQDVIAKSKELLKEYDKRQSGNDSK